MKKTSDSDKPRKTDPLGQLLVEAVTRQTPKPATEPRHVGLNEDDWELPATK